MNTEILTDTIKGRNHLGDIGVHGREDNIKICPNEIVYKGVN
jgi:hypothetical protein